MTKTTVQQVVESMGITIGDDMTSEGGMIVKRGTLVPGVGAEETQTGVRMQDLVSSLSSVTCPQGTLSFKEGASHDDVHMTQSPGPTHVQPFCGHVFLTQVLPQIAAFEVAE